MTVYDQEVSRKIFDLVNEERQRMDMQRFGMKNTVIREALPPRIPS